MNEHFEAIMPREKVDGASITGSMISLKDGRVMLISGHLSTTKKPTPGVTANFSSDGGRTWSDPFPLNLEKDSPKRDNVRPCLIRLASGKLGLARTRKSWDDFPSLLYQSLATFHTSQDEGQTWSDGVVINPNDNRESNSYDNIIQLPTGRLLIPFWEIKGPKPTIIEDAKMHMRFGERFSVPRAYGMQSCLAYYSDDEGRTWHRSRNEVYATIDRGVGGSYKTGEPAIAELADGRILLLGHTELGRLYKSYSEDGGETWLEAEPTDLVCKAGPMCLKRLPDSDDLLVIWNQVSAWEQMIGIYRHRLTCAISSDGGVTWKNHKNLESLDDVSYLEPGPIEHRLTGARPCQPIDRVRYHRAPRPLRMDQPACAFHDGTAIVFHGHGVLGNPDVITNMYGMDFDDVCARFGFKPWPGTDARHRVLGNNKIHVVPIEWFYN